MRSIKKLISDHATGKKTIIFFVIANIFYAAMLMITIPKIMEFSGGLKIPDMMPRGYDANHINSLFSALESEGRAYYLYRQIPLDMVYPALFAISYSLIMAFFLKKLNRLNSFLFITCLLPLIAGLADYAENLGIIMMLDSYPKISQLLISTTSVFSFIKSISTTIYFISLIMVLIVLGYRAIKMKSHSTA
jgi:hypothetical protein